MISIIFCIAATIIPSFLLGWATGIDKSTKTPVVIYRATQSNITSLLPDDEWYSDIETQGIMPNTPFIEFEVGENL